MKHSSALREALTSQLPNTDLTQMRAHAMVAIEHEQRNLRRRYLAVQAFWIFCAVSATIYMWFGPDSASTPRAPFLALFFILWGGIEVLKQRIHAARMAGLIEVKRLQLDLAELRSAMEKANGRTPAT